MSREEVPVPAHTVLQGYLHKQSKHLKLWKVRYFILASNVLLYSHKSGKKARICAKLHNTAIVDDQNAVQHANNYVFELRLPSRNVYLSASTEQERQQWVSALRSCSPNSEASVILESRPSLPMVRLPSDSTLSVYNKPRRSFIKHRKKGSKDRKAERKRQTLPKLRKSFIETWNTEILPTYPNADTTLTEGLCFVGIPKQIRGRVWSALLGNKLQISEDLFSICKSRAEAVRMEMALKKETDGVVAKSTHKESGSSMSSGVTSAADSGSQDLTEPVDPIVEEKEDDNRLLYEAVEVADKLVSKAERSIRLIDVDMPRTFGHHPLFQPGADGYEKTVEVLEAYICYRPDLGYVQGMSYLAAALCFHMDTFSAFKALVSLLSSSLLFDLFRMGPKRTFHYLDTYKKLLEFELPTLAAHFEDQGIDAQMYAVDWMLTLFTRSLPLELAFRIWDCYVYLGSPFFFQASLGLLGLHEDVLLTMEAQDINYLLHNFPKDLSSRSVFEAISNISLSCKEIDDVLRGGTLEPWSPDDAEEHETEFTYPDTYD